MQSGHRLAVSGFCSVEYRFRFMASPFLKSFILPETNTQSGSEIVGGLTGTLAPAHFANFA
jgi:hypothetical protein